MSKIKTANHPRLGIEIVFREDDHTYIDETGVPYTSVTRVVKSAFPEFDSEKISEKYAAKHGLDAAKVRAEWERLGEEASDKGSRIHAFAEHLLIGSRLVIPANEEERSMFESVKLFVNTVLSGYEVVGSEMIVFSPNRRIAGTLDLLVIDKKTRQPCLLDWKTNKKIVTANKFQKGLGQLSHLDDCNYVHYALQMSIYRRILQEEGYLDLSSCLMNILHVTTSGVVVIPVGFYESETAELMKIA